MSLMVLLWVPWSQQDEGRGAEGDDEECDGKGMGEMVRPIQSGSVLAGR